MLGVLRLGVVALCGLILVVVGPAAVAAHTEFERSEPTDGATLAEPPSEVVVLFTKPVTLVGAGFEVLLPTGAVVTPLADSPDRLRWSLPMPEGTTGGPFAVRYSVLAEDDGHPIEGGFAFLVEPATSTTTPTTGSATTPSVERLEAAPTATTSTTLVDEAAVDEFLEADRSDTTIVGWAGRALGLLAVLISVGVSVMVSKVVFDDRLAVVAMIEAAALAGLLLVVASGLEAYSLAVSADIGLAELATSELGRATMFRAGAGTLLGLVAMVAEDRRARWGLLLAVALGVASYGFDGHTLSNGPRVVHGVVAVVHVVAVGTWAGGLALLGLQLGAGTLPVDRKVMLVVRFSAIAGMVLVPIAVSGVVMAWLVADSPGELFTTSWGRTLVAKTVLVLAAGSVGALNRFKLLPRLESDGSGGERATEPPLGPIVAAIRLEVALLTLVALLTAVLVAASTGS